MFLGMLNGLPHFLVGPLNFNYDTVNGSLPSLVPNEYSWTKVPFKAQFDYNFSADVKIKL